MDPRIVVVVIVIVIVVVCLLISWALGLGPFATGGGGPATPTPQPITKTISYEIRWDPQPPGKAASPKKKIQVNIIIKRNGALVKLETFELKITDGSQQGISSYLVDGSKYRPTHRFATTGSDGKLTVDLYGYADGDDELNLYDSDENFIDKHGYETLEKEPTP